MFENFNGFADSGASGVNIIYKDDVFVFYRKVIFESKRVFNIGGAFSGGFGFGLGFRIFYFFESEDEREIKFIRDGLSEKFGLIKATFYFSLRRERDGN